MTATVILYFILYFCALIFLIGCAVRAVGYAKLPLHLRWELYPVPHEANERAEHGGSYLETSEWWTKERPVNRSREYKAMAGEICFLKGLWDYKKKMWFRSYPFHLGLYMLILTGGLLFISGAISVFIPGLWGEGLARVLHDVYTATGVLGATLALIGAIALLVARLTDDDLRIYTTPGDIFNLAFFIVALGLVASGYLLDLGKQPVGLTMARGLFTFDTSLRIPPLLEAGFILGGLLIAYIPMTHMSHFIAKYFMYHSVRWDDSPNLGKGSVEKRVAEYLMYRPTWAAPHIGAKGGQSWADLVANNPAQGAKK